MRSDICTNENRLTIEDGTDSATNHSGPSDGAAPQNGTRDDPALGNATETASPSPTKSVSSCKYDLLCCSCLT
jgi:hypothetical protein